MDNRELVVGAERHERHLDQRHRCWTWTEPLAQYRQIRQPAGLEFHLDQSCKLRSWASASSSTVSLQASFSPRCWCNASKARA